MDGVEGADGVTLGGVLLRVGDRLVYVRAAEAVKLVPFPQITRIPGSSDALLGVALFEGGIVPVVSVGHERESMLVCSYAGALVGVVGGSVVASGMFRAEGSSVRYGNETASVLDLPALCASILPSSWAGGWLG